METPDAFKSRHVPSQLRISVGQDLTFPPQDRYDRFAQSTRISSLEQRCLEIRLIHFPLSTNDSLLPPTRSGYSFALASDTGAKLSFCIWKIRRWDQLNHRILSQGTLCYRLRVTETRRVHSLSENYPGVVTQFASEVAQNSLSFHPGGSLRD